jgi:hypothetical protein
LKFINEIFRFKGKPEQALSKRLANPLKLLPKNFAQIAPPKILKDNKITLAQNLKATKKQAIKLLRGQVTTRRLSEWAELPDTPDFFRPPTIWRVTARCF